MGLIQWEPKELHQFDVALGIHIRLAKCLDVIDLIQWQP